MTAETMRVRVTAATSSMRLQQMFLNLAQCCLRNRRWWRLGRGELVGLLTKRSEPLDYCYDCKADAKTNNG